jgi:hypothetical protein
MSVISATQKVRSGKLWFETRPGKKVLKTPSQPIAGCGGACQAYQAMLEAEIGKTVVPDQPEQKVSETPSQWKKAGHGGTCLSSQE